MKYRSLIVSMAATGLVLFASAVVSAADAPTGLKLTQYDKAAYCDLVIGPDGKLHAVFTERPAHGQPLYLYYRASTDDGRTWTDAVNLSDDESGHDAGYARLVFDGKGRLYAVWKYVAMNQLLDGPGGRASGRLVYRCLQGDNWSKRVPLGDAKVPSYSWFATVTPTGQLHVIWSQMATDALAAMGWGTADYANLVRQATLDGPTVASVKDLIVPRALLTAAEQQKLKAAGKYPRYEDTRPRPDGLINLRGHVTTTGVAHFVAEQPGVQDGPTAQQTGRRLVLWDGTKLVPVYAYDRFKSYNTFNNPPALLIDAAGKQHVIRLPEKAEKPCIRDYPVVDGELGDPTDIVRPKSGPGAITNWQAHQLPDGRMAVTVTMSHKGGYDPSDLEVYVCYSDGGGKWSDPISATKRAANKPVPSSDTGKNEMIILQVEYRPRHVALALGKDGTPCLLMVTNMSALSGISKKLTSGSNEREITSSNPRVENPAVYFVKPPAQK